MCPQCTGRFPITIFKRRAIKLRFSSKSVNYSDKSYFLDMKVSPWPLKWTTDKKGLFGRNTNLRNTQIIDTAVYSNLLGTGTVLHTYVFTLLFHSEKSALVKVYCRLPFHCSERHLSTQLQCLKLRWEFRRVLQSISSTKDMCHSVLVCYKTLSQCNSTTPPILQATNTWTE